MPPLRRVRVLYFAAIRDLMGRSEESLELPEEVRDVGALAPFLEATRGALAGRLQTVRVAVNESFATADTLLADGDVVALIPPVSGG